MAKDKLEIAFGVVVRRRREGLKLSQDTFADRIGMHRAYYSAIERGEKNLTMRIVSKVAEGFRSKPSELFREAGY